MKNTDLDVRIKNTARVIAKFSQENLSTSQSGDVLNDLPNYEQPSELNKRELVESDEDMTC